MALNINIIIIPNDRYNKIVRESKISVKSSKENLGLSSDELKYIKLKNMEQKNGDDILDEFEQLREFIWNYFNQTDIKNKDKLELEFINYGDTELVYVLKDNVENNFHTVLIGQPMSDYGSVKHEYDILKALSNRYPNVVLKPYNYYTDGKKELYMTPYIYQARCIACDDSNWGIYIPEPFYRFESFTKEERNLVNTCMIANLVRLYDEERQMGIADCKIGGGDFILDKKWSFENKTLDNTLNNMKLIAARRMVNINFDEYLELIHKEFIKSTYYYNFKDKDDMILINQKARIAMSEEEIESGIRYGKILRKGK